VKFIFLSADAGARDEATRMGAIFLKKPASLGELLQAIEALATRDGNGRSCGSGPAGDGFTRRTTSL